MRLTFALLLAAAVVVAPDARRGPALGDADRIRLAEAFHLADTLGDQLWKGWSSAPFAVLLVTPDQEFLVRHPKPTPECARLDDAVRQEGADRTAPALRAYLDAKRALRSLVSPDDYKYFSFQLWQEGIARYTEYRIGALAATGYAPTPAFAGLPDATTYASASQALLERIHSQLTTVRLGEARRSAFYPVGAAEGLLLDRVNPGWRAEYAQARFTLDGLPGGAR